MADHRPALKGTKRRRSRKTPSQRIAECLRILNNLRAAEWMVTPDWAPRSERHAVLAKVDELLSSEWAQRILNK